MIIKSPEEMIKFGEEITKKHSKVLLYGELGAGKTHFSKGFAKGIGINPDIVQSPTYTYINIYENKLLHIDMYRLQNENEAIEKGIIDQINSFDYILIEWPKFEDLYVDKEYIRITINKIDEFIREIIL